MPSGASTFRAIVLFSFSRLLIECLRTSWLFFGGKQSVRKFISRRSIISGVRSVFDDICRRRLCRSNKLKWRDSAELDGELLFFFCASPVMNRFINYVVSFGPRRVLLKLCFPFPKWTISVTRSVSKLERGCFF